ncbi:MAG: ATP-binding protein, partial [Verrucomicrobiota bacterium]
FEAAEVDLRIEIAPDLPYIKADPATLTTALINLLDNAYKYSNHPRRIELVVKAAGQRIAFSVCDNGIGLSPADRRQVMDRFFRANTAETQAIRGTGLGLNIVKYIVDAHQGEVSIESQPGAGSTFVLLIPALQNRPAS